ncbi:MAG TPA: retropepsin-like aspartic protease [Gemmatales bacterium]|nr:retropepsin-like aspartic protease [Gemmatales bacterium]
MGGCRWLRVCWMLALLFLAVAIGSTATASQGEAAELDQVLADARQALGLAAWDRLGEIELRGESNYFGLDGTARFTADRQGRFHLTIASPLGESRGWDGQAAWLGDRHGGWRRLHFREEESVLTLLPFLFGGWLRADDAYETRLLPRLPESPGVRLEVRRKDGLVPVTVRLDPESQRPIELRSRTRDADITTYLSDYRAVGGLQVPMTLRQQVRGLGNVLRFSEAESRPAPTAERYRFTARRPEQVRFDPNVPAVVEVKKSRTGHMLVRPLINDKEAGWFILDSGAGAHALHARSARELGLPALGKVLAAGVGDTIVTQFRKASTLQVGPLRLPDQHFVEIDLTLVSAAMGEAIAGVVGYPLFQAAIVEFEVEPPALRIHVPERFELKQGEWQELRLDGNVSCVEARFEGDRSGWFRLDTGASNMVTFHAPVVERLKLLEGRQTQPAFEGGVGGVSAARAGKLAWFELGGQRFENIDARFSAAEAGAFRDEILLGNIGQGLLRPFRVAFDYGESRFAFVPK